MASWKVVGATAVALAVGSYFLYKVYVKHSRKGSKRTPGNAGKISKLIIYPIKSCGGIEVEDATCTAHGLVSGLLQDRRVFHSYLPVKQILHIDRVTIANHFDCLNEVRYDNSTRPISSFFFKLTPDHSFCSS